MYFKFAMGGDQYLGRILALLNPNDNSFEVLPPHWKYQNHESVVKGLQITFGNVLTKHKDTNHDPTGILSLLLASIVYHSYWLLAKMSEYPDHQFHSIKLLSETALLQELKKQVTL